MCLFLAEYPSCYTHILPENLRFGDTLKVRIRGNGCLRQEGYVRVGKEEKLADRSNGVEL